MLTESSTPIVCRCACPYSASISWVSQYSQPADILARPANHSGKLGFENIALTSRHNSINKGVTPLTASPRSLICLFARAALGLILLGQAGMAQEVPIVQPGAPGEAALAQHRDAIGRSVALVERALKGSA